MWKLLLLFIFLFTPCTISAETFRVYHYDGYCNRSSHINRQGFLTRNAGPITSRGSPGSFQGRGTYTDVACWYDSHGKLIYGKKGKNCPLNFDSLGR